MPVERGFRTTEAYTRRAKQRPKQGYETVVPPGSDAARVGNSGDRQARREAGAAVCLSHLHGCSFCSTYKLQRSTVRWGPPQKSPSLLTRVPPWPIGSLPGDVVVEHKDASLGLQHGLWREYAMGF